MIERVAEAELAERAEERLGLGIGELHIVDDDERRVLGLGRERVLQSERADLLGQVVRMAAHHAGRRRGRRPGTAERWRRRGGRCRCPSACRASWSCGRCPSGSSTACVPAWRLASCQRTQRASRSARGSRPKIASLSSTEPAFVAVERGDIELHHAFSSWASSRCGSRAGAAPFAASRNLPGIGTSFGSLRFTASRT